MSCAPVRLACADAFAIRAPDAVCQACAMRFALMRAD